MKTSELDGLIALKLIAERRNFAAAASALGVSPSAVSQIIKTLERRLGVALLTRTTRTTSLTEAGSRFLKEAGPAIDQILAAMQEVGSYAEKPSGVLRLNLPRLLYTCCLAPIVGSFLAKYPEVTMELFFEDATSDVVDQGFDAGKRLSDILAKDMVAMKLMGPVRFVVAASPKYWKKHGRPKHPKDLLQHNCIINRLGEWTYDRWEFEGKGGEFQVQVKGNLVMNDSINSKEAAVQGLGVVYTLEEAIQPWLQSGKLEVALSPFAATSAGFYLYYPQRSQVLPKLRAFIDHAREYLAENKIR